MVAGSGVSSRGLVRRDSGASLVEFALLAPLLFAILLGTITGGLAIAQKNSMTNAVREGGRLGATLPEDATDGWNGWADDVAERVDTVAGGDLEASQVCVQVWDVTASPDVLLGSAIGGDCPAGDEPPTPGSATTGCLVKVWAEREAGLNAVFFSRTLTLEASAVGVYERPACPS